MWAARAAEWFRGVNKDVKIGAAKGGGGFAVDMLKGSGSIITPGAPQLGASLTTHLTNLVMPKEIEKALQPSNKTQASAAKATKITLTALSLAAGAWGLRSALAAETTALTRGGSLTPGQTRAVQNFANKYETTVDVVGSRAAGTATASSDFDYVIGGTSKIRSAARSELPRGQAGGEINNNGVETGIDIFNGNKTPTDTSKPYIRFEPKKD